MTAYLRRVTRPRRFEHRTIQDWVLGPAWAGLHWPNWETLYAVLRTNAKDGPEVIRLLTDAGAPEPKDVDRKALIANVPSLPEPLSSQDRGKMGGRGNKAGFVAECRLGVSKSTSSGGTTSEYLAARLKRDAPEIAARIEHYPSIRAAAKAAGIVRDPTFMDYIRKGWRMATPDERQQIAAWIAEQATS